MDTINCTELTKTYVALSNKHEIELIMQMFSGDATYYSSYFGEFKDRVAIKEMMVSFFTRFSDAFWEVQSYRLVDDRLVEFAFIMTGTDAASGETVERHGLERVFFDSDGLINRIAVFKPGEVS